MKLITKNTNYAVRALCFMAKDSSRVYSVNQLVRELKLSRPFLRKILQRLNKEGMLRSYKGKGGGFILARPAQRIFLAEMIRIFQGPVNFINCLIKKRICSAAKHCALKRKIEEIERYVVKELNSITIESLC